MHSTAPCLTPLTYREFTSWLAGSLLHLAHGKQSEVTSTTVRNRRIATQTGSRMQNCRAYGNVDRGCLQNLDRFINKVQGLWAATAYSSFADQPICTPKQFRIWKQCLASSTSAGNKAGLRTNVIQFTALSVAKELNALGCFTRNGSQLPYPINSTTRQYQSAVNNRCFTGGCTQAAKFRGNV